MAFTERSDKRQPHSVTFQDGNQHRLVSSLATLHYEGDNGLERVDMRPERIQNAQLDGWRITNNGWHYALGQPAGESDGWVGFGGKRGQHWFRFRLARVGYLRKTTAGAPLVASNWHDIGGVADYNRANLSQGNTSYNLEGQDFHYRSVAEWRDLWNTPDSGEAYVRWVADGDQLKEDVVINQAAREWMAANRPPSFFGIPASNTYFGMLYQVDWSDIPQRLVNSIVRSAEDDFTDDEGPVELRNALDELLAFMPIDDVYVIEQVDTGRLDELGETIFEPVRHAVPLRKRFWHDGDGNYYLVVGALVSSINALPAGDLIFDPTLNPSVSASADDARVSDLGYSHTTNTIGVGGNGTSTGNTGQGWRFLNITLTGSDTVDTVRLDLVKHGDAWVTITNRWTFIAEDNTATFSSGNPPGARAIVSGTPIVDDSGINRTDGTTYPFPPSASQDNLALLMQEVIDRAGWASGNALAIVNNSKQDASAQSGFARTTFATWDHTTHAAPILVVDYTAGGAAAELASSVTGASATPDTVDTTVEQQLASNLTASSSTSDVDTTAVRQLATTLTAASTTPDTVATTLENQLSSSLVGASATSDIDSEVERQLNTALTATGTTPDIDSTAIRQLATALSADASTPDTVETTVEGTTTLATDLSTVSSTPDIDSTVERQFVTNLNAAVSTSDVDSTTERQLATALIGASSTSDADSTAVRQLGTAITAGSQTSDITSIVERQLVTSLTADSATPDDVTTTTAEQIVLATNLVAASATPDIDTTVQRQLSTAPIANSQTADVDSTVERQLQTALTVNSQTPDINAQVDRQLSSNLIANSQTSDIINTVVERQLSTALTAVSQTPDTVSTTTQGELTLSTNLTAISNTANASSSVRRSLSTSLAAQSNTSDVDTQVLRQLATAIAAATTTPDNVATTFKRHFSINLTGVSATSTPITAVARHLATNLAANSQTPNNVVTTTPAGIVGQMDVTFTVLTPNMVIQTRHPLITFALRSPRMIFSEE